MILLNLPFQEKDVIERKHSFLHMSQNVPFLFVPCQILLRQCPETFFGVQNMSFCVQKASLSVRTGRVRMKIHSVPFFESSSLKTRFRAKTQTRIRPPNIFLKNAEKTRSLETQVYTCLP